MLLDMALALALLLLVCAIAWPLLGRGTTKTQQSAIALDIATLLRSDRSKATLEGRSRGTQIDLERRVVTSATGRQITVPDDVAIEITAGSSCLRGSRLFVFLFSPDGSSCGGNIFLRKRNRTYVIRINWLSGMIDVVDLSKT